MAKNINFLSPHNYKVVIAKIPNIEYFTTGVIIPALNLNPAEYSTPTRQLKVFADHLNFEELILNVIIDEDMENYKEIFDWINEIVYTNDNTLDKTSDITVMVMNSKNNVIRNIRFTDAYPVSIGDIVFESNTEQLEYLTTAVNFVFTDMIFE
jgi:hypothetical protein